jgi:integrase
MSDNAPRDAAGRRLTPQQTPEFHKGRPPRNKGRLYPADPPTTEEGLRIHEALLLSENDLDHATGSLLVRRGKGGKRRMVGMDDWGWRHLDAWLEHRPTLPYGTVFCVIGGPTAGRPWDQHAVRAKLRSLATATGVRRRFAPHQLRHAFAVEVNRASSATRPSAAAHDAFQTKLNDARNRGERVVYA